jgi:hypothetical protein
VTDKAEVSARACASYDGFLAEDADSVDALLRAMSQSGIGNANHAGGQF